MTAHLNRPIIEDTHTRIVIRLSSSLHTIVVWCQAQPLEEGEGTAGSFVCDYWRGCSVFFSLIRFESDV